MSEPTVEHLVHRLTHGGVGADRQRVPGRALRHGGHPGRVGTELLEGREDISLGEDAHQRALLQHEDRTYPRRRHGCGGLGHHRRGLHRDQIGAHDIANGRRHRPPSRVAFQNRTPLPVRYENWIVPPSWERVPRETIPSAAWTEEKTWLWRDGSILVPSPTPLGGLRIGHFSEPWGWLPRVERRVSQGSSLARTTFGPRPFLSTRAEVPL